MPKKAKPKPPTFRSWDEADGAGASKFDGLRDSWTAVCMALLASPNFHIY